MSFRYAFVAAVCEKLINLNGYHDHTCCGQDVFFSLKRGPKLQVLACGDPRNLLALKRYPRTQEG